MTTHAAESPRQASGHAAGFTLIEVLAALVIVALGMLGAIEAVTQNARNGTYLRDKTLAHWVAMNVITEQRLQQAAPPVAESSDDVEFAGQRWHWTLKVSQTQVQSMRRLDVTVRPADAPDSTALASVAGFYGTAISPTPTGTLPWSGVPGGDGGDGDSGQGAENDSGNKSGGNPRVKPPRPPSDDE
ncbi:MAG TPA: type II secretion system minor pseudopilin GspI [Steroidobacteraceae bacterium]|nr:type II secretion system minor pseudopilin GspI [Steroidobacteraceae bacterium]